MVSSSNCRILVLIIYTQLLLLLFVITENLTRCDGVIFQLCSCYSFFRSYFVEVFFFIVYGIAVAVIWPEFSDVIIQIWF